MTEGIENIGRKDVVWNLVATFFKIGAGVLLLPLILRMLPSETVGIWMIFTTITGFVGLLDFGFNPSFTRNISYIFSGVDELKPTGFGQSVAENSRINYSLLKGTIAAMRWFYSRMALIVFFVLSTAGTYYLYNILESYSLDKGEVYSAWGILCVVSTYNLYTLYYDSLMQGKGMVKRSKQIQVLGNSIYLIIATLFILLGYGLVAIVSAQVASVVLIRVLSHRCFFTSFIKQKLREVADYSRRTVIQAIYPNALKIGLTSVGAFLVSKSAMIIGAMYLSLEDIASYGITMQLIGIISALSVVYFSSYSPRIFQWRVVNDTVALRKTYLRSVGILIITFVVCGLGLVFLGDWALDLMNSQTSLLSQRMTMVALLILLLESNHSLAGALLLAKNEVPFFKAALWSGVLVVALLLFTLDVLNMGLWGMILSQGIAQGIYQNWKWPLMVCNELKIIK